jgi:glyoxylase-like metal-dependent hydrolase (beta-lactamase superfamily II)
MEPTGTRLASLPAIERVHLADVTRLPDWHPALPGGRTGYPVFGYLIRHPEGPILVDTGIGTDSARIRELYAPVVTRLETALGKLGIALEEIRALVNTHLHFDHCGQNSALLGTPTYVQRDEIEAVRKPLYTVREWAEVGPERLQVVNGDAVLAPGIRLLSTPGHAPGHQSVLVEGRDARAIIVGQAAWTHHELSHGDPDWDETALASVQRLRALGVADLYYSHDPKTHRSGGRGAAGILG